MKTEPDLTLPECLFLLARDDMSGRPLGNYNRYIQPAGAIAELQHMGRLKISQDRKMTVSVVDPGQTGNAYLDAVLQEIASSSRLKSTKHWVRRLSRMKGRIQLIGQSLADKGLVEEVRMNWLGLFPITRWPQTRAGPKTLLKEKIGMLLFEQSTRQDPKISVLVALASSGHLLKRNFDRRRLREHKAHIRNITRRNQPIARAVSKVIEEAQAAVAAGGAV